MQRSNPNTRNPYVRSGVSAAQTPDGRPPSRLRPMMRRLILIAGALALLILAVWGIGQLTRGSSGVVRINARATDNIQPFGDRVLYYDTVTLYCLDGNGNVKWTHSLGTGANYSTNGSMVVTWVDNRIAVINREGQILYSDHMDQLVQFARVGESYVAVCTGSSELNTSVRILTHTGALLENVGFEGLYLLDVGFFSNKGQLLWVLGLDIGGNVPITNLSTYEPGRLTGAADLQNELVYRVYTHNNNLMVVDTSKIRTFNYKCVEQSEFASILTYGWQVRQVKQQQRNTMVLLEQLPSTGTMGDFSEVRLVTNYQTTSLRLLTPCFASGLGDKGVYGFSASAIYFAPYGSTQPRPTHLQYQLSGFVCMLDGNRAVVTIGEDVCIIKLPT